MALAPALDAVPDVRSGQWRPRKRSGKLHADEAYDHRRCCRECRARFIVPRIAKRGVETFAKPGRYCWVAERTFA